MSELFQTKPTAMTAVKGFYTSPIDCHCAFIGHLDRDKRFCASPSEYLPPWLLPSQLMIPPQISPFRLPPGLSANGPSASVTLYSNKLLKILWKKQAVLSQLFSWKTMMAMCLAREEGNRRVGILLMPSPSTLTLFCVNGVLSGNQHFHRNQDDRFRVRNMTFKG